MRAARLRTVGDVLASLEARAPVGTAESWDNVGLLVGDASSVVRGAVVAVDLTPETLTLAERKGYRLIINHHPCIFPRGKGPSQLLAGALPYECARRGISVIACHTNFDQCALEVVDAVAQGLGVSPRGRLLEDPEASLTKLVTYVPEAELGSVQQAVFAAGAGGIGRYDLCGFSSPGEGTFRGQAETNPYIGQPGHLERVGEVRFETVFPKGLRKRVLQALRQAHPYEEVAYDLYAVKQAPPQLGVIAGLGYGFWAEFTRPKAFSDLAQHVKSLFQLDGFWIPSPPPKKVRRIAYVPGKGASFLKAAAALECDLLITGEAGYHVALEGTRRGVAVMELGHRQSERFFVPTVRRWLKDGALPTVGWEAPTQVIR